MLEDEKKYIINIKKQLNIKEIIMLILIVLIIIGLIMITKNSIEIMKQHKVYEQYEAQIIALKKQEEEKQAKIEKRKEEIRQAKLPKLTQERKK